MSGLTDKQRRFVEEYLVDLNATQAAIRAGYSEKTAEQQGPRLLGNVGVRAAILEAQRLRAERTSITAERVLRELWDIATADPNELVQYRIGACPCCWEEPEVVEEELEAQAHGGALKRSHRNVATSDPTRDPNPECTVCVGEGIGRIYVPDTRTLSGAARKLYAGVKTTKDGIEVKMRSQDAALGRVFDHLGMGVKRHEHSGPNGGPIPLATELTDAVSKLSAEDRALLRGLALKLEGK